MEAKRTKEASGPTRAVRALPPPLRWRQGKSRAGQPGVGTVSGSPLPVISTSVLNTSGLLSRAGTLKLSTSSRSRMLDGQSREKIRTLDGHKARLVSKWAGVGGLGHGNEALGLAPHHQEHYDDGRYGHRPERDVDRP